MAIFYATIKYNAGSEAGTNWTDDSNAWNDTDGNYATRSIAKNTAFETTKWIKGTAHDNTVSSGTITKVEIGVEAKASGAGNCQLQLVPMFGGSTDGDTHNTEELGTSDSTTWFDITSDTNAPDPWTWTDVNNLDVRMYGDNDNAFSARTISIDQIYLKVSYSGIGLIEETVDDGFTLSDSISVYGGTSGTPANPNLSPDNFNDNSFDTNVWTKHDADSGGTGSIDEQNQRLEFSGSTGASTNNYWQQQARQTSISGPFDIQVKVTSVYTENEANTYITPFLDVWDGSSEEFFVGIEIYEGTKYIAWTDLNDAGYDYREYSWTLPVWLRIKYTGSNIYLYTSENGSDWTEEYSNTHNVDLTTVGPMVFHQTTANTNYSGYVYFDDFVVYSNNTYEMSISDGFTLSDITTASGGLVNGSQYDCTVTGTLNLSETLTPTNTLTLNGTDSVNLADTNTPVVVGVGSAVDGFNLSETLTPISSCTTSVTDGFDLNDGVNCVLLIATSIIDSISISDTAVSSATCATTIQDSVDFTDTPVVVTTCNSSITDSFTTTDEASCVSTCVGTITDGLTLDDSNTPALGIPTAGSDSLALDDNSTTIVTAITSSTDSISLQDTTESFKLIITNVIDSISLGDTNSPAVTAITSVTDGLDLQDTPSAQVSFVCSVSDAVTTQEVISGGILFTTNLSDSLDLGDSNSVVGNFSAGAEETLSLQDVSSTITNVVINITDTVDLQDITSATLLCSTATSDDLNLQDATSFISTIVTELADSLGVNDTTEGRVSAVTNLVDSLNVGDTVDAITTLITTLQDDLNLDDSVSVTVNIGEDVYDSLSLDDVGDDVYVYNTNASDGIKFSETIDGSVLAITSVGDGLTITGTPVGGTVIDADASDSINLDDIPSGLLVINMSASEDVSFGETLSAGLDFARSVSDDITLSLSTESYLWRASIVFTVDNKIMCFDVKDFDSTITVDGNTILTAKDTCLCFTVHDKK